MAGSPNPGYNANMQAYPIPDYDAPGEQPQQMIDWASPIPGQPTDLVDALSGDTAAPGNAFIRVVSPSGQADVPEVPA